MLKDLMFTIWAEGSCESATDTVKLLSLVDFYLPFLPLERDHLRQLTRMRLRERQAEVLKATGDTLTWSEEVIEFLTAKVCLLGLAAAFPGDSLSLSRMSLAAGEECRAGSNFEICNSSLKFRYFLAGGL